MGFQTDCIHAGQEPDPTTGAVSIPIYQTSTYVQRGQNVEGRYDYARTVNPTRLAVEANLAALEGGTHGLAFASGMAAIDTVLRLLRSGDHVVVSWNVYGGTYRLFTRVLQDFGLSFSWVDTADLRNVEAAIRPETRMLYCETPTNPVMTLTDLDGFVRIARERGLITVVDNTFMSPALQRPLDFGVDVVLHSTTKYLNGHSDSVGGVVVTSREPLFEKMKFLQNSAGAILSPFDSWLVLRGTKTLAVRMRQHDENGRKVAGYLAAHPKVRKVHYPGLPSHPQHQLALRQMRGFGAMIAFETGSLEAARRLLGQVRLCALAESLGGVESLICHPASMTHGAVPAEDREKLGITDGLVRISVGIEDAEDIIADLDRAFAAV